MTFATWSQTANSNTSVGGISTDGTVTLVKQIDNMFRGMMAELAVARDDGTIAAVAPRGYLHGLTISNNASDAVNDIDIAVGEAATVDSPYWRMTLASALTKRLDAAWAVGTGNGGRMSAAAIADTTYHVWLIARSDTGVVDVGFDVSATSPTMPANYDRKRRIGSIVRSGGVIILFKQNGDWFGWDAPISEWSDTNPGTAAQTKTLTVPIGIVVKAKLSSSVNSNTVGTYYVAVTELDKTNAAAGGSNYDMFTIVTSGFTPQSMVIEKYTNTLGQVRVRLGLSNAATSISAINYGYYDDRGRSA